jgi:hypothetical protein
MLDACIGARQADTISELVSAPRRTYRGKKANLGQSMDGVGGVRMSQTLVPVSLTCLLRILYSKSHRNRRLLIPIHPLACSWGRLASGTITRCEVVGRGLRRSCITDAGPVKGIDERKYYSG